MKSLFDTSSRISLTALAAGMLLTAAPAFAEEAKDDAAAAPEQEIVVTAQFREQKLQDTPLAITAVNSAMLAARGQTDIAQVAAQAPNVTLRPQQQSNGIGLIAFIRGIGQTDFNYALEPGVGIYVDDVYIPTLSSSLLDLMDLDRIEVLRGPQGTLAGKNSIGGAIKLFSKKPEGSNHGSIQATYGRFNRIDFRGVADFKIAENFFARVSGVTKNQDGYVTLLDYGVTHPNSNVKANTNGGTSGVAGTLGGKSFAAGKIALRWIPSDAVEVNISADYTHERDDAGAQVLLYANNAATTPDGIAFLAGKNGAAVPYNCAFVPMTTAYGTSCDTTPAGFDARFINYGNFLDTRVPTTQAPFKPYASANNQVFDGWGLMGNVTAHLTDNLQMVWISSYRKYHSGWGEEQDGSPVPISLLYQTLHHHAWSQELRLNGKLGNGLLDYTLGGFYFDQNGSLQARVDLNYAGIDFIHGPDTTPSTSKALFFNGTLHPTDAWSISAGIRQSWDKKVYTYFRSNPDGTVPSAPCAFFLGAPTAGPTGIGNAPNCLLIGLYNVQGKYEGKRTDWRIETDYRFSPEFFVYASVATGYKGGGVNPRPFFGPSAGDCAVLPVGAPCNQITSFSPETLTTYEFGFKSDLLDRKLRLNGALFYNKYNNIILTLTSCHGFSPCLMPANVGKADVKGFELEMSARPGGGLSLDGSLSYIDFQYKNTGVSGVPLTNVTPYTPKWTYSFGVQEDVPMKAGTLSFRFDGQYQSEMYTDAFNGQSNRIDPRFLANGRITFTMPDNGWQVSAEVQNIFNKYYYQTVEDAKNAFGTITASPGMPRTWSVTVKKDF